MVLAQANASSHESHTRLRPAVNLCFSTWLVLVLLMVYRAHGWLRGASVHPLFLGGGLSNGQKLLIRMMLRKYIAHNRFCVFLPLWDAHLPASYNGAHTAHSIDCLMPPPPLTFAYPRPHLPLSTLALSGHLPKLFCHLSPLK